MAQVPDPIVRWAQPDHPLVQRFAIELLDRDCGSLPWLAPLHASAFRLGERQDIPARISSTGPPQRFGPPHAHAEPTGSAHCLVDTLSLERGLQGV
jgi:hypothetical protein